MCYFRGLATFKTRSRSTPKKSSHNIMGRLSIGDRRLIAVHAQYGNKTFAWLRRKGFTQYQITRWKDVPFTAPDSAFADQARGSPPEALSEKQQRAVMRFLEKDEVGIVAKAAKKFKVSEATVRRIGNKFGGTVSCHYQVHISDAHAVKRVVYAKTQKGQNHSRKCWADHTKLTVPPEPHRHRVWRAHDSRKPVPVRKRWKSKTSFLMLLAGCETGLSKPVFAVEKKRRKRRKSGEETLGYRWETVTVDESLMKDQLEKEVFGFMDENNLNELILDNASCQDGIRSWIEDKGYKSPGFASARRNQPAGYPPNSPDCMLLDAAVFGRFKVLFAEACPKTIPEAIRVATKIVKDLDSATRNWVEHLDTTYQEIIDVNGAGTHYMDDMADVEED